MSNQDSKLNWKFEYQLIDCECLQQDFELNYKFECQAKAWNWNHATSYNCFASNDS